MFKEKNILRRKRKIPDENNENLIDISIPNKKTKSNADDFYFSKINNKYKSDEEIEELNNKKEFIPPEKNKFEMKREEFFLSAKELIHNEINKLRSVSEQLIKLEIFKKDIEYDFYELHLMDYLSNNLLDFNIFKEDFTHYVYNNLNALLKSQKLNDILKKIACDKKNELFFKEFINFSNYRWNKIIESGEKYNIDLLNEYKDSINPEIKSKKNFAQNYINFFNLDNALDICKNFPEDNQLELIIACLVYNSMTKYEKEIEKEQTNNLNKNINNNIITPDKLEIQNFNLSEMPMISVLTGVKFNKNITEINLSGNYLSHKTSFYLGTCVKILPFLTNLDLSKCYLNNDKLYMFYEGTKYDNNIEFNKEQFNLEKLNLKDNFDITDNDIKNNKYEHPLVLLLKIFKLKNLNLTNIKFGGKVAMKLFKKMEELIDKNQLFLENLILINNNIKNEECLNLLGNLLLKKNCPIKKLILSKNLISTPSDLSSDNINNINYFEIFMKCIAKSKVKELFLLNCNIGNNENDINILYEMLKENKSLYSIRLYGNRINDMKSFAKILGIFSDYNKPLENNSLKYIDLSKNQCDLIIDEDFMKTIEKLKLEYLDINQNNMKDDEKEIFQKRTNELTHIRITY